MYFRAASAERHRGLSDLGRALQRCDLSVNGTPVTKHENVLSLLLFAPASKNCNVMPLTKLYIFLYIYHVTGVLKIRLHISYDAE